MRRLSDRALQRFPLLLAGGAGGHPPHAPGPGGGRGVPGQPPLLYSLTEGEKERLEGLFPGKFDYTLVRDGFDYCYDINRLADLTGKKLHAKRNHIHRFEEHYPGWTTEEIGPHNLQECIALNEDWEAAAAAAGHEDWNAQEGVRGPAPLPLPPAGAGAGGPGAPGQREAGGLHHGQEPGWGHLRRVL